MNTKETNWPEVEEEPQYLPIQTQAYIPHESEFACSDDDEEGLVNALEKEYRFMCVDKIFHSQNLAG